MFGQTTWRPDPRLTVEGGLRVEASEIRQSGDTDTSKTLVYPKPRVLVTWTPAPNHQFRFRIERTAKPPGSRGACAAAAADGT